MLTLYFQGGQCQLVSQSLITTLIKAKTSNAIGWIAMEITKAIFSNHQTNFNNFGHSFTFDVISS